MQNFVIAIKSKFQKLFVTLHFLQMSGKKKLKNNPIYLRHRLIVQLAQVKYLLDGCSISQHRGNKESAVKQMP